MLRGQALHTSGVSGQARRTPRVDAAAVAVPPALPAALGSSYIHTKLAAAHVWPAAAVLVPEALLRAAFALQAERLLWRHTPALHICGAVGPALASNAVGRCGSTVRVDFAAATGWLLGWLLARGWGGGTSWRYSCCCFCTDACLAAVASQAARQLLQLCALAAVLCSFSAAAAAVAILLCYGCQPPSRWQLGA